MIQINEKLKVLLLALLTFANANAQKLPNKQEANLRAPADIKIDGKSNEWGNYFKAYNKSTDVFYTIANNDEDLYLIVHAEDEKIIRKIMVRGVTITVKRNTTEKSFTFPAYDGNSTNNLDFNLKAVNGKSAEEANTIVMRNNRIQKAKHKLIMVKGITGVDTLLSVYNEIGIRVAGLFDSKNTYTLEMAINLKLIGLSSKDASQFRYQLKVNGQKFFPMVLSPIQPNGLPPTAETVEMFAKANERLAMNDAATDFWGEYTLAK